MRNLVVFVQPPGIQGLSLNCQSLDQGIVLSSGKDIQFADDQGRLSQSGTACVWCQILFNSVPQKGSQWNLLASPACCVPKWHHGRSG